MHIIKMQLAALALCAQMTTATNTENNTIKSLKQKCVG